MESKRPWASKTLWVNLIAFVAAASGAFGLDLGLDAEAQASLVGGIMAVVNIVLRLTTNGPVSFRAAWPATVAAALLALLVAGCASGPMTPEQKAKACITAIVALEGVSDVSDDPARVERIHKIYLPLARAYCAPSMLEGLEPVPEPDGEPIDIVPEGAAGPAAPES